MSDIRFIERVPTVDEYADLIRAVGWKPRDRAAIARALANSLYAVCAESSERIVGMGRVIGDGALHFYLSDVAVLPEHQRQGIGTEIVARLNRYLESVPYQNTLVGVITARGTRPFYERCGYRAQSAEAPAMYRWLNGDEAPA
jgi:GNAT superfamily N-acetyltransferase